MRTALNDALMASERLLTETGIEIRLRRPDMARSGT